MSRHRGQTPAQMLAPVHKRGHTARTGTSQCAIDWAEGEGPRISHLHPWVSRY
jgi:hypothetical protein